MLDLWTETMKSSCMNSLTWSCTVRLVAWKLSCWNWTTGEKEASPGPGRVPVPRAANPSFSLCGSTYACVLSVGVLTPTEPVMPVSLVTVVPRKEGPSRVCGGKGGPERRNGFCWLDYELIYVLNEDMLIFLNPNFDLVTLLLSGCQVLLQ